MDNELNALLNLLGDTNREVVEIVESKLLDKGISVVPILESVWEDSSNEILQHRLENIIQDIQQRNVTKGLSDWVKNGGNDIIEGAFYIASFKFHNLQFSDITKKIELLTNEIADEITPYLSPLEKIKVINHILFDIYHFSRNIEHFYSPDNSFINLALESRKGNSIILSIIYETLAQKLDLPIYGVDLPQNFILAYKDHRKISIKSTEYGCDILFYINPFNNGAVMGKQEIDHFLRQQKIAQQKTFYEPCSNINTIIRLIINLTDSYNRYGYLGLTQEIQKLLAILKIKN